MRLIIVDDEAIERQGLAKILQTEMPEITIIGEARNGRAAIELADQLKPDAMMMDIKMPGIDGVEAVKAIRKKHKQIKFIMVSAFNTFEYAKEVMQQGVREYLLKPSNTEEVVAALRRVQHELEEEQAIQQEQIMLKEKYRRALSLMETEWLSSLLLEQVEEMYIEEWNQLLSFEAERGFIIVFSFANNFESLYKEDKKNCYEWLKQKLKTKYEHLVVGPMIEDKIPVLLLIKNKNNTNQIKAFAKTFCRTILYSFHHQFSNVLLIAGIGLPYAKLDEFNKSYHEALAALDYVIGSEHSYRIITEQTEQKRHKQNTFEKEKEIIELLKLGERLKATQVFDFYFQELVNDAKGHLHLLIRSVEEFFAVVSRDLYHTGLTPRKKLHFNKATSIDDLKQAARMELGEIIEYILVWRKTHIKGIIHKAKDFIDEKFREAITLEETAEYVSLSPFYFSKIFKERMGVTFIDYVTDLRVNFAKEEMISSNKSLKEICFDAGYKDPNYFSRVFKKKTGDTPTDFRSRHVKKDQLPIH